jgi:hypothetical protein
MASIGAAGVLDAASAAAAAPVGFSATASMLQPSQHATATTLKNGDVLVAGGQDAAGTPLATAELYNPADGAWTRTGSMLIPLSQATATLLENGDVLVAGGLTEVSGSVAATAAAELYHPSTGVWTATGSLKTPSFDAGAALLTSSGDVLRAGGLSAVGSGAAATAAVELYDPSTSSWTDAQPLPLAVAGAQVTGLTGGNILVAGGVTSASGSASSLAEVYQSSSGTWAPVGHVAVPVSEATATLLGNGDVLVAGGETSALGTPTSATQLFDPSTGRFASAGSLPTASYAATATVLASGEVLYAGGLTTPSGTPTSSAALFDPADQVWSATGGLLVASGFAVSARLPNGDALVAAGRTSTGVTAAGELYPAVVSPAVTKSPAVITSKDALTAQVGKPAAFTLTASGSPAPSLTESGALPGGLVFRDNHDGSATIYGTPAASDSASYDLTVYASNGVGATATQRLVISLTRAPAITSGAAFSFTTGKYAAFTVTATGAPVPALSEAGALPAGLVFRDNHDSSATIYGTPAATDTGTYDVTVYASNGLSPTAAQRLAITVTSAVITHPAVITSAASTTMQVGKYAAFTVVTTAAPVATVSESGTLPPGLVFSADAADGTATISGTPAATDSATYDVTIYATNHVGATAAQRLVITLTRAPAITSGAAFSFTTGKYASFTVTATGAPAPTLSESGTLPAGLAFHDNANGSAIIYGTPAASDKGTYDLIVYASNGLSPTAAQRLAITVTSAVITHPAVITSAAVTTLQAGRWADFTVSTTASPVATVSEYGALPLGLVFHAGANGTATISGTPAATDSGIYDVTIYATNHVGATAAQRLALTVDHAALISSPASLGIESGTATSFTVVAGGTPVPTLSVSGVLPPGLGFHADGDGKATISGTTSVLIGGTYTVTIVATNGVGSPAVQRLSVVVSKPTAAYFSSATTRQIQAGVPSVITVSSAGVPTPRLSESGALPTGLSFRAASNGTATISGAPAMNARGAFAITLVATNGVGSPAVQRLRIDIAVPVAGVGYWYVTTSGQVLGQGAAKPIAAVVAQRPSNVVAMASTPDQNGYYLVSKSGGVFAYGDAVWYGSIAHFHLASPTVAIAVTPSGRGYYLVTKAGNVFNFGDAPFYGSAAHQRIAPVVAFAVDPSGTGYWVVTTKGNVYVYGSAPWLGAPSHRAIPTVVAFASDADGGGYWLVTSNGEVLNYGNARYFGSMAGRRIAPVVGFGVDAHGAGYWLVTSKGNVYNFGMAGFFGSSAHTTLSRLVTGFVAEL